MFSDFAKVFVPLNGIYGYVCVLNLLERCLQFMKLQKLISRV